VHLGLPVDHLNAMKLKLQFGEVMVSFDPAQSQKILAE